MMFEQDRTGLPRAYVALPVEFDQALRVATTWAFQFVDDWNQIGLRIPLRSVLHDVPALADLERQGVKVSAERQTSSNEYAAGPLVVFNPLLESLAAAEEVRQATALVVVAADPGLRPWVSAFRPVHLGGDVIEPSDPVVSDPVTWQAMKTFTTSINSSTGLKDPRDLSRVTDGLQKLRVAGHTIDPDELMSAALRLNWRGTAAWDLRELGREVKAGARKRLREHYSDDIVETWRIEASNPSS